MQAIVHTIMSEVLKTLFKWLDNFNTFFLNILFPLTLLKNVKLNIFNTQNQD